MSNKTVLCIIDDNRDEKLSKMFLNSIRKFHDEEELPVKIIKREDYTEFMEDPHFYYRAKCLIAKRFIDEYDTVIVADADQIMTGDISHILSLEDYDIGTVMNFNKKDTEEYGVVSVFNIPPQEYLNAGFIAIRNKNTLEHWHSLCMGRFFPVLRYREQDLLNIIAHYGNYAVRVFDLYDPEYDYSALHGLASKGWWDKIRLVADKFMLLPEDVPALLRPTEVKILHWAGGNSVKMNYKIHFNEECIKRLDYLVSGDEK